MASSSVVCPACGGETSFRNHLHTYLGKHGNGVVIACSAVQTDRKKHCGISILVINNDRDNRPLKKPKVMCYDKA